MDHHFTNTLSAQSDVDSAPELPPMPLLCAQLRMWALDQTGNGAGLNVSLTFVARGLKREPFQAALGDLLRRQVSLRAVFSKTGNDEPRMVFRAEAATPEVIFRRATAASLPDAVAEAMSRRFNLGTEIPLSVHVIDTGTNIQTVFFVMHHIALDAWSVRPLIGDLMRAWHARADGTVPRFTGLSAGISSFVARQQSSIRTCRDDPESTWAKQTAHWRSLVSSLPPASPLSLPVASISEPVVYQETPRFYLSADLHARLIATARSNRASLFMVLHAGLLALLARMGAGNNPVIYTVVPGRADDAAGSLVGLFENALILVTDLTGASTFRAMLARVRQTDLLALADQDVPFAHWADSLAQQGLSLPPWLFQIGLVLHQRRDLPGGVPGLLTTLRLGSSYRRHDGLTFHCVESVALDGHAEGIRLTVEYGGCFGGERMIEMLRCLVQLLEFGAAQPEAELDLFDPARLPGAYVTAPATVSPGLEEARYLEANEAHRAVATFVLPRDVLQDRLACLWESCLGVHPIGIWDRWLDSGGTIESGIEMLQSLEALLGSAVSANIINADLSVQKLSDVIYDGIGNIRLLERQPLKGGARPPFFIVHGDLGGGGFYTHELSLLIGHGQPFCVLQQHGVGGRDMPASITAMADDHIAVLDSVWPEGPLHLGGYCVGAVIAFEIARRLRGRGRDIRGLVMIEAPSADIFSAGRHPPKQPVPPSDWLDSSRTRRAWLLTHYIHSARQYTPKPYGGKITILGAGPDVSNSWRPLANAVEFYPISGNHITCLGRHIQTTAARLRECLN